jgi:hypothetical protein
MEYRLPLYVVSDMTVSDGLGSSYPSSFSYGGGKLHHLGRGWLGLRWMESNNNDPTVKSKTKEYLNQTFPFTGTSSETEVYDAASNPVIFAETWNTYINPAPNPYPGVYFVAPNRVDVFQHEGQGTPRQTARTKSQSGNAI